MKPTQHTPGPLTTGFQIRFDGPPGEKGGRFVEIEDLKGRSFRLGEWVQDCNHWLLRVEPIVDPDRASRDNLEGLVEALRQEKVSLQEVVDDARIRLSDRAERLKGLETACNKQVEAKIKLREERASLREALATLLLAITAQGGPREEYLKQLDQAKDRARSALQSTEPSGAKS